MRSFRSRRSIAVLVILALTFSATVGLVIYTKYSRLAGAVAIPGTEPVLNALLAYAADNAGRGPDHAIRLVVDDRLTTGDFVSPHTVTVAESVPLADTTLAQFANLSPERKQTVAAAAASLLGDGVVAHRLGDFVFTHHGIDLTNPDPGLWLVAWLPDPSQNTPPDPQERAPVGLAGGEVIQITLSSLSESVSAQNVLRAEQGLLPLPNPFTVTHARPAAAGPQAGRTGFGSTP